MNWDDFKSEAKIISSAARRHSVVVILDKLDFSAADEALINQSANYQKKPVAAIIHGCADPLEKLVMLVRKNDESLKKNQNVIVAAMASAEIGHKNLIDLVGAQKPTELTDVFDDTALDKPLHVLAVRAPEVFKNMRDFLDKKYSQSGQSFIKQLEEMKAQIRKSGVAYDFPAAGIEAIRPINAQDFDAIKSHNTSSNNPALRNE